MKNDVTDFPRPMRPSSKESEAGEFEKLRRAQPADFLFPATKAWLAALPETARPSELAKQYPRIANSFASGWKDRETIARLFDGLFVDRRGNRVGFPPEVKADLTALWLYWNEIMPMPRSPR